MTTNTKRVAKRKLSNFDFSGEGAHIALVHKEQGGSANGYSTLITKATGKYSEEFIAKTTNVQVTLTFEEFLQQFFDLWHDEAKILATVLGMEDDESDKNDDTWYQNYIETKVEKFEILKSAYEAENKVDFLASLPEDDYLSILLNQEMVEKALEKAKQPDNGGVKEPTKKAVVNKTTTTKKATKAVTKEENNMSGDNPEVIAKAQYDEVQKALDEQKVELQKALDAIAVFKAKEKEAVVKARKATLLNAVEVEATAEDLFKAVGELEDEAFESVVGIIKKLNVKVEDNSLFIEKGKGGESNLVEDDSPVAKAFRELHAKK